MNSCYFNDSSGNVEPTTYQAANYDPSKRKIIQYVAYADSKDDNKHGTHVAGTSILIRDPLIYMPAWQSSISAF